MADTDQAPPAPYRQTSLFLRGDPWNLHRRQLTTSQRAEVARTLKTLYEEQAERRMHLAKGQGVKGVANSPQVKSRDQAAAAVGWTATN